VTSCSLAQSLWIAQKILKCAMKSSWNTNTNTTSSERVSSRVDSTLQRHYLDDDQDAREEAQRVIKTPASLLSRSCLDGSSPQCRSCTEVSCADKYVSTRTAPALGRSLLPEQATCESTSLLGSLSGDVHMIQSKLVWQRQCSVQRECWWERKLH